MTETSNIQDFQQQQTDNSDVIFVGRARQLTYFGRINVDPWWLRPKIVDISGPAGVGKTALLEQYKRFPLDSQALTAIAGADQRTLLEVLLCWAGELEKTNPENFKAFNERYRRYGELKAEIAADPRAPQSRLDFAAQSMVESELEEKSALTVYIERKITDKADRLLLLDPETELSDHFAEALSLLIEQHRRVVLVLDDYEYTAPQLRKGIQCMLKGNLINLSHWVHLVMIGRRPLSQSWVPVDQVLHHELPPFLDDEAGEYLRQRGQTEEATVQPILRLAEGNPALLAFLTSVTGTPEADETAAEYFLRNLAPDWRGTLLAAAVPRYFNPEILALITDNSAMAAFEWLTQTSFVRPCVYGWRYNEKVRQLLGQYLQLHAPERWQQLHQQFHDYYQEQQTKLTLSPAEERRDPRWRALETERIYHRLSLEPLNSLPDLFTSLLLNLQSDCENGSRSATETAWCSLSELTTLLEQIDEETHAPDLANWRADLQAILKVFDAEPAALCRFFKKLGNYAPLSEPIRCRAMELCGYIHYEVGDYAGARLDFTEAARLQPGNGGHYHWRGRCHYALKEYPAALADFTEALRLQSPNGWNYHWRGRCRYALKDYRAARADFTEALRLQPDDGYSYHWRGGAADELQDYPSALADFTKAIRLLPQKGYNYYRRGYIDYRLGDYPSALADFTEAVRLQPEGENYFRHGPAAQIQADENCEALLRGIIHYGLGDYSAALIDFTAAVQAVHEEGTPYYWRGRCNHKLQDYPAALVDFTEAIRLQPEEGQNYHWRSRSHYELKDYPAALTDLAEAIRHDPNDADSYHWRGRIYRELNDQPAAWTELTEAIRLQPENGDHYRWRGSCYHYNNSAPALTDFIKAIRLQPNNADNFYRRGQIYHYDIEDYPMAWADFTKAIRLQPDQAEYYSIRGTLGCDWDVRNYLTALADFNEAIRLQPNNEVHYGRRGYLYSELKNYPAALNDLTAAIQLGSQWSVDYYRRGCIYNELQDYPAALADFTEAIRLDPNESHHYYQRGLLHYHLEDYPAALADFTAALEFFRGGDNNDYYAWCGRTHLILGDPEAAQQNFSQIHCSKWGSNEAAYIVAGGFARQGDVETALECLEIALTDETKWLTQALQDPDFAPIREHPAFQAFLEEKSKS